MRIFFDGYFGRKRTKKIGRLEGKMEDNCLIARDNFCFACFLRINVEYKKEKNAIFLSSKDDGTRVTSRRHCSKKETKKLETMYS